MKGKKLWLIVSAVLLLLLTLTLVGCSTMGTLFNCFTNLIGCSLQTVGKCNTCQVPYVFWSLASCGVLCRNCDLWKECGCGETNGNTRLQFTVTGYTEETAKDVEKALFGLPGVLFVHIHAHDGETTVDYSPKKTKLTDILGVFQARGLEAAL